ncbi:MAG: (d)CMP kinase [Moraxellaceae bacterium]
MSAIPTIITIDGPSGSGKGTLAARLAVHYGFHLLDSGALYRLLGLAAQQRGLLEQLEQAAGLAALIELAKHLDIQFVPDQQQRLTVLLDRQDVTEQIRTEQIGLLASKVAVIAEVRAALLMRQRDFAQSPGLVADGRDMGTVVFTEAPVKIYLTASAEARASRRVKQLQGLGLNASMQEILSDLVARDKRDMERSVAPLRAAADAFSIDSSDLGIEAVFQALVEYADRKLSQYSV